jgi:hypothetical protein
MTDDLEFSEHEDDHRQSMKIEVIEHLFFACWPEGSPRPITPMIVTQAQLRKAIEERNARHPDEEELSPGNAPNFLKDFIRKRTCNANWPKRLKARRITARQVYGQKRVMEFVDYGAGDEEPFPNRFDPAPGMPALSFESLSIPIEARVLGRLDEPWLIQVIVSQRILHTHFAIVARHRGFEAETLAHLQMSVKTQPEIDATFVANVKCADRSLRAYVTCEAKQFGERILEDQIRAQIAKAFDFTSTLEGPEAIAAVVPVVLQVVDYEVERADGSRELARGVYVVQFEMIERTLFDSDFRKDLHSIPLSLQSQAFYEPFPQVQGISKRIKRAKRRPERKKIKPGKG